MKRVVPYTHRYKRPPRKKKPAAPLSGPKIVTIRRAPAPPPDEAEQAAFISIAIPRPIDVISDALS